MRAHSSSDFQRILGSLLIGASLCSNVLPAFAQQSPEAPATSAQKPAEVDPAGASDRTETATAEAPTEEDKAAAKEALATGLAAYQAGDYAAAAAAFETSASRAPSVEAQFWSAMALDLQGKTEPALRAFELFFADPAHASLGADRVEPARQRFEVLKKIPASVTLSVTPADATLKVNGQAQPGSGVFVLKLPAGKHLVQLEAPNHESVEMELQVGAAQTLEKSVALEARPAAPAAVVTPQVVAPPLTPAAQRNLVPAYVTLGVAGAGAVVGTIFGFQALGAKSDFDKNPTTQNADDVERNALISDMAFGLAFTLGLTGVILLTTEEPAERAARSVPRSTLSFAPYVSPTGGGAAASATF